VTDTLLEAVRLGLLWGIMGLGVWITFRVLSFADLTVEGSFILGAGVAARLIVIEGFDPVLATVFAMLAGMAAGLITGFFHTVFKIPPLLSGILTMFGLHSVVLRIMTRPNIPTTPMWMPNPTDTLMTRMHSFLESLTYRMNDIFGLSLTVNERVPSIVVGVLVVVVLLVLLRLFFNTELGYALRATGDNEAMVKAKGINSNRMKVVGLALGNGCVALAGSLMFQARGVADISDGQGIIVFGIAALIIGEVLFSDKNSHWAMAAVVFGSIIYRILIALVLRIPFVDTNDFRMFTAVMIAIVLALPMFRQKLTAFIKRQFFKQ